jgi:peptidoglycan/xylan/chitin deacetylase (PgdA/CDA1 family)
MYHSIDDSGSPVSVSPKMLASHFDSLSAAGYTVLPLGEALARLWAPAPRRERLAALTFDDGYASVHKIAWPLLAHRGWRATVFAVSDYVGRDNRWPGQAAFVPAAHLLTWKQLEELTGAGWEIGAHTRMHPDLTGLSARELESEVVGGKVTLEDRLGYPVEFFAYPSGHYDERVRGLVRRHFRAACTTNMGWATTASDCDALERLEMWYFAQPGLHRLFLSHLMRPYVTLCRAARARHWRAAARTSACSV